MLFLLPSPPNRVTLSQVLVGKASCWCSSTDLFSTSTPWHHLSHALKFLSFLLPQENFCSLSVWIMHGSLLNWLMCSVILTHFRDIVAANISERVRDAQHPARPRKIHTTKNHAAMMSIVPPTVKNFFITEVSKSLMAETQRERTFLWYHMMATLLPLYSPWPAHIP